MGQQRFGNLSPVYEHKINLADSETLLYWRERILAAKRLCIKKQAPWSMLVL
jgi:hypothetical protein